MTEVCGTRKFEWVGDDLFMVTDSVIADSAWVDSFTIEEATRAAPETVKANKNRQVFIVQKADGGNKLFKATTFVRFAGGDLLCFISPLERTH